MCEKFQYDKKTQDQKNWGNKLSLLKRSNKIWFQKRIDPSSKKCNLYVKEIMQNQGYQVYTSPRVCFVGFCVCFI